MRSLLKVFGTVLVLGGLAHTVGVIHFYWTAGLPDANRVLIDIWVAEAQLLGGGLYLLASTGARSTSMSRALSISGALIIVGFTLPMLPVLFMRAPIHFRIPAIVYLLVSIFVFFWVP